VLPVFIEHDIKSTDPTAQRRAKNGCATVRPRLLFKVHVTSGSGMGMQIARARTHSGGALIVRDDRAWHQALLPDGKLANNIFEVVSEQFGLGEVIIDPQFILPFEPPFIVAVGLNYMDHVLESGLPKPDVPLLFSKHPSSVSGPNAFIEVDPSITSRVDWEVELAVVIGRTASKVSPVDALDYVFGYTIANDVSARDIQFSDGQWMRGKSLATFCPIGPYIVSRDQLPDPQKLALRTRVNGELLQNSSTEKMIVPVREIIAYCSQYFTLRPGDMILTGTPWGCGEFMKPRRSLADGDEVEVSIEGIGTMTNTVRFARG